MLIENTGVGVIAFAMKGPTRKNSKAGQMAAMTSVKPVIAIPGVNHISDEHWKELESNPSVVKWIKDGRLKLYATPSKEEAKAVMDAQHPSSVVHDHFYGMEEGDVVELVGKTLSMPLLENWVEGDNRPKIVHAIQKQMKKCGPTEVKKEE